MNIFQSHEAIILISVIVIFSYFFNLISRRTNIPSVIMLIGLGILIQEAMVTFNVVQVDFLPALEVLGIVGLIMIVLEAALDLDIHRQKMPMILKALGVATFCLLGCTAAIAYILDIFLFHDFMLSVVYAIPLAIMSSAIIIPSVNGLTPELKEFMIYDGTFSDIIGIMLFYFLIGNLDEESAKVIAFDITANIFTTIILSVLLSYILVWVFQQVKTDVKIFLLLAVLLLLYSVGKLFHLSSLIIILIFGLMLNNHHIFFRGKLKRFLHAEGVKAIYHSFHTVTMETAFVVRTFFFVIFGITIVLTSLVDIQVALIAILIVGAMYIVRAIFLQIFFWGKDITTALFIAPRGLITILLFYTIPENLQRTNFDSGILLYVILITSVVMSFSLVTARKNLPPEESYALPPDPDSADPDEVQMDKVGED